MAGRIVVGVDGSASSRAALRWAVEEAELRGAKVEAVHAWTYVPAPMLGDPGLMSVPTALEPLNLDVVQEAAQAELDDALTDAYPDGVPGLVEGKLVDGDPSVALERESEGAELLVVGHRGRSGIASVLLGSVAKHALGNAHCPVVVVRAPDDES